MRDVCMIDHVFMRKYDSKKNINKSIYMTGHK